jgi:DNA replication protein DnaC
MHAARCCFAHIRGAARPPRRSRGRRARKQAARHAAQVCQPQAERTIEDLNTKAARGLDKALFAKLATGDWIGRRHDLLITGKTGTGKSWLACALGHKACRDDRSVLYYRVPRLLDALALARGDGRYVRLLKSLARVELLILDDWGLAPLTSQQGRDLLEIVDDRHGRGSTIVTSQLPVDHWHEVSSIRPSPTPSSTASCTPHTALPSTARPCANHRKNPPGRSRPSWSASWPIG